MRQKDPPAAMDMTAHLTDPAAVPTEAIAAFRQEFVANGGDMDGCFSLRRMENIADWLAQVRRNAEADTCEARWVPSTQFVYLRPADGKVVGVLQIRHYLNDYLRKYAGHIGYSVCHSERRRGYATRMLRDALPICRRMGFDKVLVCCLVDNEGSRRTILNCGGVYQRTVWVPRDGVFVQRYWIAL